MPVNFAKNSMTYWYFKCLGFFDTIHAFFSVTVIEFVLNNRELFSYFHFKKQTVFLQLSEMTKIV